MSSSEFQFPAFDPDFFEAAIRASESSLVIADARIPDCPLVFVNEAFERLTGYTSGEVLGRNCRFLQRDDREQADLVRIREAIQAGQSVTAVLRNYRKDGTLFWNKISVAPITDRDGQVTHFVGVQTDITQIKALEARSLAELNRLRELFEAMPAGVLIIDASTQEFIYCNSRFGEMLGYRTDELLKMRQTDLHPDDSDDVQKAFLRHVTGKTCISTGIRMRRKDGTTFEADVYSSRIEIQGRKCLCGVFVDISDRLRMEGDLRISQMHLKQAQILAGMGHWDYEHKRGELTWSDEVFPIFGMDAADFGGDYAAFLGLVHPEDRQEVMDAYDLHLQDRRPYALVHRIIRPDGEIRFVQERCETLFSDEGAPIRSLGVVSDITELKQAERELLEKEKDFRHLFETMDQGAVYQDATGLIVRANPAATRLLGLSMDQLCGRESVDPRWRALRGDGSPFPGEEHPAMVALRTGQQVSNVTMGVYHPERDEHIWIQVSAQPEFRPGETVPYRVFTTFTDITARKQAAEELERQTRILELLIQTSSQFIVIPADSLDSAIDTALADLGRFFGADRMYVFAVDFETQLSFNTHEWCAPGVEPQIKTLQGIPVDGLDDWMGAIRRGECFEIRDVSSLPEGDPSRAILEPQGIRSLLSASLMEEGECVGFIGLDFNRELKEFTDAERSLLTVFATSLSNVRRRIRVEEELGESRRFLAGIIENSESLVAVKDREGRYVLVNEKWEEVIGHSRDQVLGRDDSALFPAKLAREFRAQDQQVLESGEPLEVEDWIEDQGGRRYFVTVKFPKRGSDGSVKGVVVMSTEVTALKSHERLERHRNEVLQSLLAAEPLDRVLGKVLGFIESNLPGVRCMLALSGGDTTGSRAVLAPGSASVVLSPESQTGAAPEGSVGSGASAGCTSWVQAWAKQDGRVAWLTEEIRTDAGQVQGVLGISADPENATVGEGMDLLRQELALIKLAIEQHQAREDRVARVEADARNRAKDAFLARMSHELRTPLHAILGFSQYLSKNTGLTDEQAESVEVISRSGELLLGLMNDIFDYAKLEVGITADEVAAFDPAKLVREATSLFGRMAEEKGLALEVQVHGEIPAEVEGYPVRFRQVLTNLVGNAVKFTQQGGVTVQVGLAAAPDEGEGEVVIQVEVVDSGPGIPENELASLFDDFFQGAAGRSIGGSGLGLAICRSLVELMGGEISVRNLPGGGACFRFDLRVKVVSQASTTAGSTESSDGHFSFAAEGESLREQDNLHTRVADLPQGLIDAIADALGRGSMQEVHAQLAAVAKTDMTLASHLSVLADRYDYARLNALITSRATNHL